MENLAHAGGASKLPSPELAEDVQKRSGHRILGREMRLGAWIMLALRNGKHGSIAVIERFMRAVARCGEGQDFASGIA